MRLLWFDEAARVRFTRFSNDDNIPPYAILSHTWTSDEDEITFQDLREGNYGRKHGSSKLHFCATRARRDGLDFFWIDTCCIDKSNAIELSRSINSMSKWYERAAKCYVYLSDVPRHSTPLETPLHAGWDRTSDFAASRWFTRGWTLQELLAPSTVEFFSRNGVKLGDKTTLERQISEITKIPVTALRKEIPLTSFSREEPLIWQKDRHTREEEDIVYSLFGIFDVRMSLNYGEGKLNAMKRLNCEIEDAARGSHRNEFAVTFSLMGVTKSPCFVGREPELQEMRRVLNTDGTRQSVTLHGLGGIGKTQLAIAYAVRHKNDYSAIFWIDAKDEDGIKSSFVNIGNQIGLQHPSSGPFSALEDGPNLDQAVEAVTSWLSRPNNSRWLLIYDDYDDVKMSCDSQTTRVDLHNCFPKSYQGSIIITSRSSKVNIGHSMLVKKLDRSQDSLEILSYASRRGDLSKGELIGTAIVVMTFLIVMVDSHAASLIQQLDGLPLALATAGAYLCQTSMTLESYCRLNQTSWRRLQETSPGLASYEHCALYSTWQTSFNQIQQKNPISANLLRLWAYLDKQDVWYELLRSESHGSPAWLREMTKGELEFHSVASVLVDHGIAEPYAIEDDTGQSRGYSIHPCVHSWTRNVLNPTPDRNLAIIALRCIAANVPDESAPDWSRRQRRLINHAVLIVQLIEKRFDSLTSDELQAIDHINSLSGPSSNTSKRKIGSSESHKGSKRNFKAILAIKSQDQISRISSGDIGTASKKRRETFREHYEPKRQYSRRRTS